MRMLLSVDLAVLVDQPVEPEVVFRNGNTAIVRVKLSGVC